MRGKGSHGEHGGHGVGEAATKPRLELYTEVERCGLTQIPKSGNRPRPSCSRIGRAQVAELTAQTSRAKVCLLLGAKACVEDDQEDEDENDSET